MAAENVVTVSVLQQSNTVPVRRVQNDTVLCFELTQRYLIDGVCQTSAPVSPVALSVVS